MSDLLSRLPTVADTQREMLPLLRDKASDATEDANGTASSMLSGCLRLLAVAKFALDSDVAGFRTLLRESAGLIAGLFDRFDRGQLIDPSYVSMIQYKSLFDSLATADYDFATTFAQKIGGRPELEKKYDHVFTRTIGYALKHTVLNSSPECTEAVQAFTTACEKQGGKSYRGYANAMAAISVTDSSWFNEAVTQLIQAHRRLSGGRNMFANEPDEVICTWGLGLVNLATHRGLSGTVDYPAIPRQLSAE